MNFNPDNLLPDQALTAYQPFDIQSFFKSVKSELADLEIGGQSVAQILEKEAREAGIDPRVLLVKLQVEQSLVSGEPTPEKLDWAMGFGATDQERFEEYRDFSTQVKMAARTLKGYLDPHHPFTVVGLVGQKMTVSDGVVVPQTLATAALYRYTPWIGDRPAAGYQPPFGNYLFFQVWMEFFQEDPAHPEGWLLIVPPDNWKEPISWPQEAIEPLTVAAGRLGLVTTTDASHRKLYLGFSKPVVPAPATDGLLYPSGLRLPHVHNAEPKYDPAVAEDAAPLVEAKPEQKLSEHFTAGEFLCHDPNYRYLRLLPALVDLLEKMREKLGNQPLTINSGYRPAAYNASVGGAPLSTHIDGLAADVSASHVSVDRLWEVADQLVGERGGVGFYPYQQFVHVDLRGHRARWSG